MDLEGGGARPVHGSEGVCIPFQQMAIKEMNSPLDLAKLKVKNYSDVHECLGTESSLTDSVCHGALRLVTNCGFLTHQCAVYFKVKQTSLTPSCFAGRFSSIRPFWAWFPSTSPLFKP